MRATQQQKILFGRLSQKNIAKFSIRLFSLDQAQQIKSPSIPLLFNNLRIQKVSNIKRTPTHDKKNNSNPELCCKK